MLRIFRRMKPACRPGRGFETLEGGAPPAATAIAGTAPVGRAWIVGGTDGPGRIATDPSGGLRPLVKGMAPEYEGDGAPVVRAGAEAATPTNGDPSA
jgi:hypothetical protein